MNKPQAPFHDLEFSRDADWWAGSDASARRAFLMPVTSPTEFLAFGVLEPSNRVHFVARGRLKDHLAVFLERMVQTGARIGLYVQAPVPKGILKRYTSGPPIESQESEDPPAPPVLGLALDGSTPYVSSLTGTLWTEGDASTRRISLVPTHEPAEFLAIGGLSTSGKELFMLRGFVQEDLGKFVTQMVSDGARVELYSRV